MNPTNESLISPRNSHERHGITLERERESCLSVSEVSARITRALALEPARVLVGRVLLVVVLVVVVGLHFFFSHFTSLPFTSPIPCLPLAFTAHPSGSGRYVVRSSRRTRTIYTYLGNQQRHQPALFDCLLRNDFARLGRAANSNTSTRPTCFQLHDRI